MKLFARRGPSNGGYYESGIIYVSTGWTPGGRLRDHLFTMSLRVFRKVTGNRTIQPGQILEISMDILGVPPQPTKTLDHILGVKKRRKK